jgi:hypothetical protein
MTRAHHKLVLALLLCAWTVPAAHAIVPVLIRRDGTVINLSTGIATRSDGSHYRLSPAALQALIKAHAQENTARPVPHKGIPHRQGNGS